MTRKATIGSVSHGTLKTVDLIDSFASELDAIGGDPALVEEAKAAYVLYRAGWGSIGDTEEASELLVALLDALNELAPAYAYFGAHEGDGSDFGFWPYMYAIEELPRVSDPSEVETMGEDCVFVNDHGNVTVYATDGSIIFDIV